MDYHHLEELEAVIFDGVYTMEAFVHATDPGKVVTGSYRILRPGSRIALFEYDHKLLGDKHKDLAKSIGFINEHAAMPTNALSQPGVFKRMLEEAGFEDVKVRDYFDNIKPMTKLFYKIAYIYYLGIKLLRMERWFINTVAGVSSYKGHEHWRYVAISATKPEGKLETAKTR